MNLEQALVENTAALNALREVLTPITNTPMSASAADKPARAVPRASVPAGDPAPKADKPKAPPAAPAPTQLSKDGEHPNYTPLKKPFLDLVTRLGRDKALAVIAPLTALNEIKAGEQFPGQYDQVAQKLAAVEV
jgi:hypothetical protein